MRGAVVQKPKVTGRWYVVLDLDGDGTGRPAEMALGLSDQA
jgi:hypothetical protein